ncbi:phage antirepressor [Alphaproteobacteria bacterium]|nr:phage antirepressor [Alphaproteobacteria bacterium]
MSNNDKKIVLFQQQEIRREWDEEDEKWRFSVVDVVAVLTEQSDYKKARNYWHKLSERMREKEGSQLVTNCHQLKMTAADGKKYLTDVMDTEQILRLIQSIPSKRAEPFKLWLAKVGNEFINEATDPELAMNRAVRNYRNLGYSENWINQRLKTIEARKALTDEWDKSGVKEGAGYAGLTDLMYKTWADMNAREYKKFKGLKKENLRDNMTNAELVLNMLAEVAATELSIDEQPETPNQSAKIAKTGASVAKNARLDFEKKLGRSLISPQNARQLGKRDDKMIGKEIE